MTILLNRTSFTEFGTFGVFHKVTPDGSLPFAVSCEDKWMDNQQNISCIPAGTYECIPTMFHKKGYECFEVKGVPNRERILIHIGNTSKDCEGCILIGQSFSFNQILNSSVAFKNFMLMTKDLDQFTLIIKDPGHT